MSLVTLQRSSKSPEKAGEPARTEDSAPAIKGVQSTVSGRLIQLTRRAISAETIVAAAIAATVLAIGYRDALTRQSFEFRPDAAGKAFLPYSYDDKSSGGNSTATHDLRKPFNWTCTLGSASKWPYCGFGLQFDVAEAGRGLDLSGYERISIRLAHRGDGKLVRIALKDRDPRYKTLANPLDKVNQANFPIRSGTQNIPLIFSDFSVAEWWKDQSKAPPELARPSFRNIVAMEVVTGSDAEPGRQQFRIDSIMLERRIVSTEVWYGGIALFWMALIGLLTLHRRRQIARLKRAAQEALSESERLHRGILQASTDVIVLLTADGHVEFVNQPGVQAMELDSAERVLGKHWMRLWRDESASTVAEALERAASGETARYRAFCATSKGTPKWWDVVVAPMHDEHNGALKGLLTISRDITSEREKAEQLRWASEHDALTHLPNRRAFHARLQAATLGAMQTGEQVGLLMIDLDHFKHVNDTLGHRAGDELLKILADRIRRGVRDGDFVARIGGDEFAIILDNASEEVLLGVGDQLLSRIQMPFRIEGRTIGAGASVGGALFPKHADSANELFKHADTALYALKQNGRGGTKLFDRYMLEEAEKTAMQLRLARGAVSEETVVPVYQPKVAIDSGKIVGFEALLRWRHPGGGLQLPDTLEEAFSDYELAAKIGELMQRKVARDIRTWIDSGLEFGRVSINAAPAEFLRDDYAERLLAIVDEYDVPAERIEVEITEHAFLGRATEYVARSLAVLNRAGVEVSLDDFGTGYSSLSHLRDFPVDVVKIDMSFIRRITENDEIASIVAAVINLARSLRIDVVAEGVETPAQLQMLRAMGCFVAQGHLFASAVEAEAVAELLPAKLAAA